MMKKDDWHTALDDLMSTVNAVGYGAQLHKSILEHHSRPYNKKLYFYLLCGGCGASLYFAVDRLYHHHLEKSAVLPSVACSDCNASGEHDYQGLVTSG